MLESTPGTETRKTSAAPALEVRVEWGEGDALRVEHFAKPRAFHVGDSRATRERVDFDIGRESLGVPRFTLVEPSTGGRVKVRIPEGASCSLDSEGATFDELALRAASRLARSSAKGIAFELEIDVGERATVAVGAIRFLVALVEPATVRRPSFGLGAWLVPFAALAFALGSVHAHREFLGRQVRYVDARIDVSHPAMAALIARRAERARNTTPHAPSPNAIMRPATPSRGDDVPRASAPPTPVAPLVPQGSVRRVEAPIAHTSSRPGVNSPAPSDTPSVAAPASVADAAPAPAPEPSEEDRANARRVALMFSMRQASRGLTDCYARFPTTGPDAATNAAHLSRCIAEVRDGARATAQSRVATNDTPGRDAALIEWDIEVDTHEGRTVSYQGGRAFVAATP